MTCASQRLRANREKKERQTNIMANKKRSLNVKTYFHQKDILAGIALATSFLQKEKKGKTRKNNNKKRCIHL